MKRKTEIGQRIRELREYLGISQKEFAKALGLHPLSISRYELGKSKPAPSVLKLIEDKFGVNPEWLKNGKGKPFKEKDLDNINIEFDKRWKSVKANLEDSAEKIVNICLDLFTSKQQEKELDIETIRTFLKNLTTRHLIDEANRSLQEILRILSFIENPASFKRKSNKKN